MAKAATMSVEDLRARLAELYETQAQIPNELQEAENRLKAARDADRFARQNVIRIRALVEIGQVPQSELKAAEHAAGTAAEQLRDAEDRIGSATEKLPALAAAIADTTEAYRAQRLPALLATSKDVAERIDQAWSALLAAFAEGDALHAEIERDFFEFVTVHGFTRFDSRVGSLPALLGFGTHKEIPRLAASWRELREKI
jgi:predicted  nucleic acid-binding Zn-ribbon protein